MRELTVLEQTNKVLRAALGSEYWYDDYREIVTDVVIGYSEPGYGTDESVVVFGNWNPPRFPHGDDDTPLTKEERLAPRIADALERVGAEIEWLDEWAQCAECYRAVRTVEDSYSWRPSYAWIGDCEILCHRCLKDDIATALEEGSYINNSDKAITWCDAGDLIGAGFTQWERHNAHTYESGWFDGQTDRPDEILAEIRRETEADVVFLLDESSQFYIRFSAWTRDSDSDDDDDDDDECPTCGPTDSPNCFRECVCQCHDSD